MWWHYLSRVSGARQSPRLPRGRKYQISRYGRGQSESFGPGCGKAQACLPQAGDIHLTERAEFEEIFQWKILAKSRHVVGIGGEKEQLAITQTQA